MLVVELVFRRRSGFQTCSPIVKKSDSKVCVCVSFSNKLINAMCVCVCTKYKICFQRCLVPSASVTECSRRSLHEPTGSVNNYFPWEASDERNMPKRYNLSLSLSLSLSLNNQTMSLIHPFFVWKCPFFLPVCVITIWAIWKVVGDDIFSFLLISFNLSISSYVC